MKNTSLLLLLIFACLGAFAQAAKTATKPAIPKVTKEETKEESKSSKYGDRTSYKITFADGTSGTLWKAKSDGKWWGSNGISDKGPYSKEEAVKWLYGYKGNKNAAAGGAAVGAGPMAIHQSTKPTPKTSINLNQKKKTSINLSRKK